MDNYEDTDYMALHDYVHTMLKNGYDALEMSVFTKKFKNLDCTRLLTKMGCDVHEDIVLLRLTDVDEFEYDM